MVCIRLYFCSAYCLLPLAATTREAQTAMLLQPMPARQMQPDKRIPSKVCWKYMTDKPERNIQLPLTRFSACFFKRRWPTPASPWLTARLPTALTCWCGIGQENICGLLRTMPRACDMPRRHCRWHTGWATCRCKATASDLWDCSISVSRTIRRPWSMWAKAWN